MIRLFKSFCREETGAVTVDWVVLTAGAVGLAIASYTMIGGQTVGLLDDTVNAVDAERDVILRGAGD